MGLIAGAIGLALIFLGCWFVRNYTQRKRELELGRALLVREQVLEARDRVAGFTAPFWALRPLRPGGAWSAQATPRLINHEPKIMSSCAKPLKQTF